MDNPLVQVDPGLFIWTILTFLLLLYLLSRYAWKPLLQALEERQAGIQQSLEDAEKARQELAQVQAESTRIVQQARSEADAIIGGSRSDAARLKEELAAKAREEAATIVSGAQKEIQQQTDRSLAQIREEAVEISLMIASKLIRRNISREDNDQLIEEALRQIQPPTN